MHIHFKKQGPGEIKRREVVLDPHEEVRLPFAGPGEIKEEEGDAGPSREPRRYQEQGGGAGPRRLDFFCFSCFPTAVLRTLSL